MRKWETWLIGASWIAVATLMPMSALQPVAPSGAAAAAPAPAEGTRLTASAACEDGAPRTLIGCLSVSL